MLLRQYLDENWDDFQNFCWKNGDGGAEEEIMDALEGLIK